MPKNHAPSNALAHFLRQPRAHIWLVAAVVVLGFGLRLWRITNPILDWHAFRQADTASVTRQYVKTGVDLLRPTYHDLSNIQSGKDNLAGYRMVEFPLINAGIASLIRQFPSLPIDLTSRLFAVLVSCVSLVIFYDLVKRLFNQSIALASLMVMAVLPYAVYYSRVVLPEPFLLFFALTALWFFVCYHQRPHFGLLVGFSASLALALLLKPFVIFYAPVFLAIHAWWYFNSSQNQKPLHTLAVMSAAGIAVLPLWWWRQWITQFPSGIPAADWLFNSNGIRWRPAWFRWLGYERLTKLMLGYSGSIFLLTNSLRTTQKEWLILASWWVGILAYLSIIATGNVQHDYYQVLTIPVVSLTVGRGAVALAEWLHKRWGIATSIGVVGLIGLSSWFFAWQQVKGYFNVNHWEYVVAGQAADKLTPPDAKIIAPAFGDTMFLYQTNRTGWPIGFEIEQKRALGATHYVTTSYDDEARMLEKQYQTLKKTDQFLLLDLTQPISSN